MGTPPIPLARPMRGHQPTNEPPVQNPPQSISGIIPWGVTTRQAAEALAGVFGGDQSNRATLALMKSIDEEIARRLEAERRYGEMLLGEIQRMADESAPG
jgi:hypothetical protein